MAIYKEHRPGTLSYVELVSSDPNGSREFYSNLFGWSFRDEDMGEHGIYTQFLKEGDVVGALYKLMPHQAEAGMPPHWGVYLTVENVADATAKAKELGGSVIMGPMDVDDHGKMCVLADPVGAVFSIWEPVNHIGLGRKDEDGTLCWAENMTNDLEKSKKFYQDFFAWTGTEMDMGEAGTYHMLGLSPEAPSCGMMPISPEMGPIPPHWLAYFLVDDLDATLARATGLGAVEVLSTTPLPGGSRFAVYADPQGAHLGIYQNGEDC